MKLFGFNLGTKVVPITLPIIENVGALPGVNVVHLSRLEKPSTKESNRHDWVEFGEDNLYPSHLLSLLSTSPIHSSIVTSKARHMAGNGVLFDGQKPEDLIPTLDPKQAALLTALVTNPNPDHDLEELMRRLSVDFQIFGAYCVEVIYSKDRSRVVEVRHVHTHEMRSGKYDEYKKVNHYYIKDWTDKRAEPLIISAFGTEDGTYNKLIYVRNVSPSLRYYGEPSYTSALSWIAMEEPISDYSAKSLQNGFSPSVAIKFYKKPASPEEQDMIVAGIKKQFTVGQNGQKVMVFFADGNGKVPDIEPIKVENLDAQLAGLDEAITQKIISAHRCTSPLLLAIQTPGKLGNTGSEDLVQAFKIFDKLVVGPDRALLEKTLRQICGLWGITAKPTIEKLDTLN